MSKNCCSTEPLGVEHESSEMAAEISDQRCRTCEGQSRPVSRKTVLLMLKPELIDQAMTGTYSFCSAPDCPVVYFEEHGRRQVFTSGDLRVSVGVKASEDPIALCYCFGFDESHIREEISRTGNTTIPERISRLIREGLCACETRNPSGVCCLGEVNKAAKRFISTQSTTKKVDSRRSVRAYLACYLRSQATAEDVVRHSSRGSKLQEGLDHFSANSALDPPCFALKNVGRPLKQKASMHLGCLTLG